MVCGHSLFEIDIGKQITCPYIRTAHGFLLLPLNSTGIRFVLQCQSGGPVFQQPARSRYSRSSSLAQSGLSDQGGKQRSFQLRPSFSPALTNGLVSNSSCWSGEMAKSCSTRLSCIVCSRPPAPFNSGLSRANQLSRQFHIMALVKRANRLCSLRIAFPPGTRRHEVN